MLWSNVTRATIVFYSLLQNGQPVNPERYSDCLVGALELPPQTGKCSLGCVNI